MKQFHFTTMLAVFMWFVLFPSLLLAESTPDSVAVGSFLQQVIFPLASAFLLGLLGIVLDLLRKKYNMDISEKNEARLMEIAKSAVAYAEEKAAASVKDYSIKFSGGDKLNAAIQYVVDRVPVVSKEKADEIIHVALGRVVGAGATKEQAVK